MLSMVTAGQAGPGKDPAPGALTASAVTHESALVSGTVVPGDKPTVWWVRYGWSLSSLKATTPVPLPDSAHRTPVPVSVTLTGLPAATRIYAQLGAASGKEAADGPILSFTTAARPATAPPPAGGTEPAPGTPPAASEPAAPPQIGATVTAAAETGTVRVRVPGGKGFTTLTGAATVPVGSIVDAGAGAIALTAALPGGGVQQATFGGGRFQVRQRGGSGLVDLHLRGGRFGACRAGTAARTVAALAAGKKRRKPVRSLWGKDDGGRFRTHGRDSVTTVRGTEWTVTDRCDGTLTTVSEGAVDVRLRRSGRVVRVKAGEHLLARHRRR